MIPILFSKTETSFSNFGIGHLSDAISPHVVEERNGEFSFEMQYPIDGVHYEELEMRSIILAKPSPKQNPQPFRVYRITKPINGIVTVYANHLRYDLEGVPVAPFTANSLYNALNAMTSNRLVQSPFTFTTDKWSNVRMTSKIPTSTLALMGGQQGSLLDIYGGEYKYDGYTVSLLDSRGEDNGVVIRYGVDLIDMQQEESCANCYTGVLCYWQSMDQDQMVSGTIQNAGTFDYTKIKVVDRSEIYENAPTQEQLNADAVSYINANRIGVPKVCINMSFANLEQTEEYQNIRQSLELCDLVTIKFEKLGVSAWARIIRTDYDVLMERYISVEIGDSRTSIADTIIGLSTLVENVPSTTEMQQAITNMTAAITGAEGGAVRLLDTDNDGMPDTLYIANDPNPLMATKVWRWNYEGWGASQNGYNGPFTMGATFAAGFIADFITAGTLSADRIAAHTLNVSKLSGSIENGDWGIDFDTGEMSIGHLDASDITSGTIDASQVSIINLSADAITSGTLDASNITVTNLNASSITAGTISAARIEDRSLSGTKLQLSAVTANEIQNLTITGSKLANATLSDTQIEYQGLSTYALSQGVNYSLGYADFSNAVFNDSTAQTAAAYMAVGSYFSSKGGATMYGCAFPNGFSFKGTTVNWSSKSLLDGGEVSLNVTQAFKVYDINGTERWVTTIGSASFDGWTNTSNYLAS